MYLYLIAVAINSIYRGFSLQMNSTFEVLLGKSKAELSHLEMQIDPSVVFYHINYVAEFINVRIVSGNFD